MVVEQRDPGDEDDYRPLAGWQSRLAQGWQFIGTEEDSMAAHRRGEGLVATVGGEYRVFPEDTGFEIRWRSIATKGGH